MKKLAIFLLMLFVFGSCKVSRVYEDQFVSQNDFSNGDLIFVEAKQDNLSGAINRVTQNSESVNFDHVGIIQIEEDLIYVLHADPKKGSVKELFVDFNSDNKRNGKKMVLYRLKNEYVSFIDNALISANTLLGKPYNWTYILNDESLYCSDFVERSFRKYSVFNHIPMNFKNLKTGEIDQFWIDFYNSKGIDVPQNQPGSNPNQLASSNKLTRIGIVK